MDTQPAAGGLLAPTDIGSRRLAAFVHADMVVYSRLIGHDDDMTYQRLARLRHFLIDPALDRYGGKVDNTAGDSLLMAFSSVISAVRFAVEVQTRIPEFDDDDPPATVCGSAWGSMSVMASLTAPTCTATASISRLVCKAGARRAMCVPAVVHLLASKPLMLTTAIANPTIPGAILFDLPNGGDLSDEWQAALGNFMDLLAKGDKQRPVVTFAYTMNRWQSRNLALRLERFQADCKQSACSISLFYA